EDARHVEGDVQSYILMLFFFFICRQANLEKEALAAAVPGFLNSCQPYFNQLESAARIPTIQLQEIIRMQLLDFSQQLCDRLEQLVLTYASYDLLCLDETEPHSVSHFFIGQCYMGQLRLSAFLYCKPLPYLAQVDTGLHKRMRWNVDRFTDERQLDRGIKEGKAETVSDTEYYFLCYEDIPPSKSEEDSQGISHCNVVRMWSIGQWVQENPDPNKDNIYDWITCSVPQADYHKLLLLGRDEPSSSTATDFLLQLLLLQHAEGSPAAVSGVAPACGAVGSVSAAQGFWLGGQRRSASVGGLQCNEV
uniref:Uncharacterized protein n=1 Tax=Mola mola TaxID=94237 RepID=A0A3Q3W5D7_MOLML